MTHSENATSTTTRRRSRSTAEAKARAEALRRAGVGEARRQRTRGALLRAAMTALGHEGGRLATVDELIAAAGVSRGTFYNHFDGREQLLEAVSYQLSHDFNLALDKSLGVDADPAARAATWIRQYLHRVRVEPEWGWTLVNVSLAGARLMGVESYVAARSNLIAGCEAGVFKVADLDATLDLTLGGVLAAAISILRGSVGANHPEATAYVALRAYGVSDVRATRLVEAPVANWIRK